MRKHFTWKGLRETIYDICSKFHSCQLTKRHYKKYGKLPAKISESIPWEILCVDLIRPYKFNQPNGNIIELWAVTMIDPATGWFKIKEIPSKRANYISNTVELTWLTRYPWPTSIILYRGKEFMAEFITMVRDDYGIK